MTDSASSGGGAHDRARARAARLTTLSRRLTAEQGLGGFTVEELCDEAGISRRTFFNYFSSKEEAVLGLPTRLDDGQIEARFVDGTARSDGAAGDWSRLLDDLAELTVQRWDVLDLSAESVADLIVAVDREPRLLPRLHEISKQRERADIELVERREALAAGDLRASSVVLVFGALARAAAEEFLHEDNTDDFSSLLRRRIDATRDLFAPPRPAQD